MAQTTPQDNPGSLSFLCNVGILCRYDDKHAKQSRKTAEIGIRTPLKSDVYFRFMVSETPDVESITFLILV